MNLNLRYVGVISMGTIVCPKCAEIVGDDLKAQNGELIKLRGDDGRGCRCEFCGVPLEVAHEQGMALATAR